MIGLVYIGILLGFIGLDFISLCVESSNEYYELQYQENAVIYAEIVKVFLLIKPFLLKSLIFAGNCLLYFVFLFTKLIIVIVISLIYALPLLTTMFLHVCQFLAVYYPHIIRKWFIYLYESKYELTILGLLIGLMLLFIFLCHYIINIEYMNGHYTFMNWGSWPPSDAGPSGTQPGPSTPPGPPSPTELVPITAQRQGDSETRPIVLDSTPEPNTVNSPFYYYKPQSNQELEQVTQQLIDRLKAQGEYNANSVTQYGIYDRSRWGSGDRSLETSHKLLLCDILKDRPGFAIHELRGDYRVYNTWTNERRSLVSNSSLFSILYTEMNNKNIYYTKQQ